MENTNATRKKKKTGHLRLVQLLFPADKAKRTHHAVRSSSHQAPDQQTSGDRSKLLFVLAASSSLNLRPIVSDPPQSHHKKNCS